jgi:NAD(P) transhydrogenase subunit beta
MTETLFIQFTYLAASISFILGLKFLGSPETARRGMFLAEIGMFMAIVGTLLDKEIISYEWIIVGMVIGSLCGALIAIWTPMTAMPQRTALSHAFGALAASLVGIAEYHTHGAALGPVKITAIGFECMLGSLTFTGSLMAAAKLQELLRGSPITYKGQNLSNMALLGVIIFLVIYLIIVPSASLAFYLMLSLGTLFGILLVLPIGAADMPVVISLLNSYAGLAGSATGFVLSNNVLIIAGALDGASGFILSVLMCKAMNRSMSNVLFGAFGQAAEPASGAAPVVSHAASPDGKPTVKKLSVEEAAIMLLKAKLVIVVPGYGMAAAQAQHGIREVADLLKTRGTTVKYAIHPVAGRMPGHMNVLLAEANVPYDELIDMDDINPEFQVADVALVMGANDVTNPAARHDTKSPIYGMPILDVDKAKAVIVCKRSMKPGFAGIDNELYLMENTHMLFGDAKQTAEKLVEAIKQKQAVEV